MLNLNKISTLVPYSSEWFENRKGMLTASRFSCLCAPKGIGTGGRTYIYNKVYEKITGKSSERNLTTEAILWGISNEPLSIQDFCKVQGINLVIIDKHIIHDSLFSCTPDALIFRDENFVYNAENEYNCETVETKSYMTPSTHMAHVECKTAMDIKDLNPDLYWQVLSQMHMANVLRGNAIFFHPDFPETSKYRRGHVLFRKTELKKEFDFLDARMEEARTIYNSKLEFSKNN